MPRGTYVVNSYSAALKKAPGATGRICSVPAGSTVTLYEVVDDMARVTYGDKEGYLPANILWLMTPATGEDTVTFDANGGEGAPDEVKVTIGADYNLPDTIPTLEGDTFLGWSKIPYNTIPDYKAGEPLTLVGDVTLYAVWEKHSVELADAAFAEGKAPLYTRPTGIENSAALLLGTLADASLFTGADTEITLITDGDFGKALSLVSTAESADPYVTLDYAALMESLLLAPVQGEAVKYAVLKVKNVSMNNTAVELSFNGDEGKVTALLADGNDWQYLVFDLADAGLTGDLTSLRIDWEKAANEAGNTMLISDIFFASSEARKDAILEGKYVYAAQELLEPETEAPTEAPTEPVTEAIEQTIDEEETGASSRGCSASFSAASAVMALAWVIAPVLMKKKED